MKGLVHIYCGEGKGKTTAATGALIRAVGNGMKVVFTQFLKDCKSGELNVIINMENVRFIYPEKIFGFYWNMTEEEKKEAGKVYKDLFEESVEVAIKEKADMLVLDEIIPACNYGFIPKHDIVSFIKNKPDKLELILTGRNPTGEFIELSDYVSEIKKVKHPYEKGVAARKGIEK